MENREDKEDKGDKGDKEDKEDKEDKTRVSSSLRELILASNLRECHNIPLQDTREKS
ncbi:hypothetical protein [Chroococcidiopsis thermalis]|uniref:hypothetical protein n=1 Tax=Chroococcidiopsis thermalis TaxID=54299 RepID=UPI0002D7ED4D|nr:hypothetical protein [Chroococcidiopsis thermalis]